MSDNSTAPAPTNVAQGTPVTIATTVQSATPTPNPMMDPKNYMELGAFILMLMAVFAIIEKRMEKRRK